MRVGIDYLGPLPISELKSLGVSFVSRYTETLTSGEAYALKDANIDIVLIHETSGHSYQGGFAAGEQEAHDATLAAGSCGMVGGYPIIFAPADVDISPEPSVADDYFKGVLSVLPLSRVWGYQGFYLVKRWFDLKLISGALQTSAWSINYNLPDNQRVTQWDDRAQIRQVQYEAGFDKEIALADFFGQWRPGVPFSKKPPADDLSFLTPLERGTVNRLISLNAHPHFNARKIENTLDEMILMQKAIWYAANKDGLTAEAWNTQHRSQRYLLLQKFTHWPAQPRQH